MIHLYHQHNRIDFQWDFNFDNASVGTFFDEYSKLLVCWPLKIDGSITHDIPFGVIQERPDRSFFPASWIDLSDGECGFAYFHQGTPRHWVSECTLFNLLAWGEQTDAIHNGMGRYQWLKSFDQRLNGCHTIRYAIYPHPGDWQPANLVKIAREYGFPPLVYPVERHNGTLPPAQSIMELVDPAISATSVQVCGEELICRVYNADDLEVTPESSTQLLTQTGLRRINGESTEVLHSFEIGELIFKKMKNN
jgi:alpha-mannosidase